MINEILITLLLLILLTYVIGLVIEKVEKMRYKKQFNNKVLEELSELIKDLEREEK